MSKLERERETWRIEPYPQNCHERGGGGSERETHRDSEVSEGNRDAQRERERQRDRQTSDRESQTDVRERERQTDRDRHTQRAECVRGNRDDRERQTDRRRERGWGSERQS